MTRKVFVRGVELRQLEGVPREPDGWSPNEERRECSAIVVSIRGLSGACNARIAIGTAKRRERSKVEAADVCLQ